jgi:hypothetical protein
MKYDIVSERIAPTYRISAPADIYGALSRCARFSRTRSESFFPITLNGPTKSFSPRVSSLKTQRRGGCLLSLLRQILSPLSICRKSFAY